MRAIKTSIISILAIGLLAGSAIGVAAQDEEADPMAPSFFTGTVGDDWSQNAESVEVDREDGVVEYNGDSFTFEWTMDDPRISGRATIITNETQYGEEATTLAPTALHGSVRTGVMRIVNDEGSWEGEFQNLQIDLLGFEESAGWLTGADAYEGLSAYWVWDLTDATVRGHITAEGPPPTPELPATE